MYKNVILTCTEHPAVWAGVTAFNSSFIKVKSKVDELLLAVNEQTSVAVGAKKIKDAKRLATAKKAEIIANGLRALADAGNDTELAELMRFPFSALLRGNSEKTLQLMDRILTAAVNHAGELPDCGVAASLVPEFATAKDELALAFIQTRNAVVKKKQQTALMVEKIAEIDQLLKNSLDKLVKVLGEDHPDFLKLYTASRIVVDHKGKSNKKGPVPVPVPPIGVLLPPPDNIAGSK